MTAGMSDVLGWTLIHFVWQGTAIAALLGLTLLVIPRPFARVRYAAGLLTLALMLAVPAATALTLTGAEPGVPFVGVIPVPEAPATVRADTIPAGADADATALLASSAPARPALQRLLPWIVGAWAIGVLVCALRLAGSWWQARRLVRVGTRPAPERWQRTKDALAARLRLSRAVELLESTRVQVPVVIGWLRPALLVPPAVLAGLTPQQLEAVLAHELAHIRRHDYVLNLVQAAVETLLFYHPAVWWVSRTVRTEREHCCDDMAVSACGDPVLYARALTAVELLRHAPSPLALAVNGSPLLARVRRLLGMREQTAVGASGWAIASLTALMVAGAGATSLFRDLPTALGPGGGITAEAAVLPPAQEPEPAPKPASPQTEDPAPADDEQQDRQSQEQEAREQQAERERALEEAERVRQAARERALEQAERERQARQERAFEAQDRARQEQRRAQDQNAREELARQQREQQADQRARQRALAEAREAMREAQQSLRAALDEHREEFREVRLEALREVRKSVRQVLDENREAFEQARRAVREDHPELEASVRKLVEQAAELSRDVAENVQVEIDAELQEVMRRAAEISRQAVEDRRPEIQAELDRLSKEIDEISSEAALDAARLAAEVARDVARKIEQALREREKLRPQRGTTDAPPAPPAPAAPPAPPAPPAPKPAPPAKPVEPPAPPVPPRESARGAVPVTPATPRVPAVSRVPRTPATPVVPAAGATGVGPVPVTPVTPVAPPPTAVPTPPAVVVDVP